jgi:hypothetical protein
MREGRGENFNIMQLQILHSCLGVCCPCFVPPPLALIAAGQSVSEPVSLSSLGLQDRAMLMTLTGIRVISS